MFGHVPGLLQQLLRIAHHLRISAQHHMAGLGVHRKPTAASSAPLSISAGTRPGKRASDGFPTDDSLNAQLAFVALLQFQH